MLDRLTLQIAQSKVETDMKKFTDSKVELLDDGEGKTKWDIKDGFWRLDCQEGAEWNFAYVLPQAEGEPVRLVVSTSLQMGWIESPPYFCAASETGRATWPPNMLRPQSGLWKTTNSSLTRCRGWIMTLSQHRKLWRI